MDSVAETSKPPLEVALVGRQNTGKTSLLMHLTGTAQRPVNFPGSSVERVLGRLVVEGRPLEISDLPGISSMRGVSPDEQVSLEFLRGPATNRVVCAVLDASKLSVEIGLLKQVMGLGQPVVVALNKSDVARAEGREVDTAALASELGIAVVETDGLRGKGVAELCSALVAAADGGACRVPESSADAIAARVQAPPTASRRTASDVIDSIVLHRIFGVPILMLVTLGMFQVVFTVADPFVTWIEQLQDTLTSAISSVVPRGALRSFINDGLVNGVGSVLVFLPQIALLIALVTLLEASGYMARAAFILDRLLRRFGLSGRSFVPLTTSFACAIPGILASRIITNERDRIATIVVSPLMSCSARLPVYVVLIGAFFPVGYRGLTLFGLYLLGIVTAVIVALILRRTVLRGPESLFMMELPTYQRPSLRVIWSQLRAACTEFIRLAGTVILVTSVLIWLLSYYPRPAHIHETFEARRAAVADEPNPQRKARLMLYYERREQAVYLRQSYLATIGKTIQPVFAPAGFDWPITVGVLAAFPARELIVPTLGILYSRGRVDPAEFDLDALNAKAEPTGLRGKLRTAKRDGGRVRSFSTLVALSLMVFFALCSQCVATLGAIRRETHTWRWPLFTFVYMTGLAWLAAVAVYQTGRAFGFGPD